MKDAGVDVGMYIILDSQHTSFATSAKSIYSGVTIACAWRQFLAS